MAAHFAGHSQLPSMTPLPCEIPDRSLVLEARSQRQRAAFQYWNFVVKRVGGPAGRRPSEDDSWQGGTAGRRAGAVPEHLPGPMRLAFAELEAGAGATLSVLLALFGARVARQVAGLLEGGAVRGVDLDEGARDAVADGVCLA